MTPIISQKRCIDCSALRDRKCIAEKTVKLSDYKPGQKGRILQICGDPDFRLRMMEMGFIRGAEIEVVKYAPLSDPMEFVIKGYHITLRKKQASHILMDEPDLILRSAS
ncbi:MAG: FeoA family protein [Desulfomonilaceae bacterium]